MAEIPGTDPRILELIPHRPPFLFVEKIVEVGERSIKTEKTMDASMDFFRGHYPGKPIVPGVILCEAVFQSGALLIASNVRLDGSAVPVITRIGEVKFRKMVVPGEKIEMAVEITEKVAGVYFMKGSVSTGGRNAMRVEFAVTLTPGGNGDGDLK